MPTWWAIWLIWGLHYFSYRTGIFFLADFTFFAFGKSFIILCQNTIKMSLYNWDCWIHIPDLISSFRAFRLTLLNPQTITGSFKWDLPYKVRNTCHTRTQKTDSTFHLSPCPVALFATTHLLYPILDTMSSVLPSVLPSLRPPSVRLRVTPLDSEMGWTGEPWLRTNLRK